MPLRSTVSQRMEGNSARITQERLKSLPETELGDNRYKEGLDFRP
jgi:hypothetical protein